MCRYIIDKDITKMPVKLIAELTYKCNIKCIYCHNPIHKEYFEDELTLDEWKRVIHEAIKDLGVIEVSFTGGEPLLRGHDLINLILYTKRLDALVKIDTNAILITEDIARKLVEAGIDRVQVGIPALDPEVDVKVTGFNTVAQRIKAIEILLKYEIPIMLNVVLTRYNVSEVEKILEFAHKMGIDYVYFQPTYLYGRALCAVMRGLKILPSYEQIREVYKIINRFMSNTTGSKTKICKPILYYYKGLPMPCSWKYEGCIVVTPNGLVTPCEPASNLYPFIKFDNIREKSLRDIWENSWALNIQIESYLPEICKQCKYLRYCRGGCRVPALYLNGSIYAEDPTCMFSNKRKQIEQLLS